MSSLFGQSTPTSTLFNNLSSATSAQSQSAPTASLFGGTSSQPQQSSGPTTSLFGTLGTSQPQTQPSLFSSFGSDQKPNLFGSSQPQQTSSLFGGAQNNAATTQPTNSFLGPQPQPQQQNNHLEQVPQGQQQQQTSPQSRGGQVTSQPAYFDNLLEKGRKRTRDADGRSGFRDVPSLQLGLGDIAKKVRELGSVGEHAHRGKAADANYFLAASGINPGMTRRDLDSLVVQLPTSASLHPTKWDPNTHKYVEQLQQQSTLRMISEALERAQRSFDAYLEENVDINWELQRKKIYEHFGLTAKHGEASDDRAGSPSVKGSFGKSMRRGRTHNANRPGQSALNRSIFGPSSVQKSVIGTPGIGSRNTTSFADVADRTAPALAVQDDRFLREKQRRFAEKVQLLNRARLNENSYPVLQEFRSVESQPGGEVSTPAFGTLFN